MAVCASVATAHDVVPAKGGTVVVDCDCACVGVCHHHHPVVVAPHYVVPRYYGPAWYPGCFGVYRPVYPVYPAYHWGYYYY